MQKTDKKSFTEFNSLHVRAKMAFDDDSQQTD